VAFKNGDWLRFLYPIDSVLENLHAVVVEGTVEAAILNGSSVALEDNYDIEKHLRVYSRDGRFLAILRYVPDAALWHPDKVFVS
jgi:tRNA U55 pseudouridine synthase TruB